MKKIIICLLLSLSVAAPCFNIKTEAVTVSSISAKAYVLIDSQTGIVIAAKNENSKLPMASTTKIMTTLLTVESGDLDKQFEVDSEAIKTEGSSMGLREGDIVTKRALCYGMMLPSGNDAANASAVLLAGDYSSFAKLMNNRAALIGMTNSSFVTPSGLDDKNHYSSAYDMALLTREALNNEIFSEICGTKSVKLEFGNPPYQRWLSNSNKLLSLYKYCKGVKTGFTDEAGRCLVSAAEKDGVKLICVTLNDKNDWNDHISLYDYGFSTVKKEKIPYKIEDTSVNVAGGKYDQIPVALKKSPTYNVIDGKAPDVNVKVILPDFVYAPVQIGEPVGIVQYYCNKRLIDTVEIVASKDCDAVVHPHKDSLYVIIINYLKEFWR